MAHAIGSNAGYALALAPAPKSIKCKKSHADLDFALRLRLASALTHLLPPDTGFEYEKKSRSRTAVIRLRISS